MKKFFLTAVIISVSAIISAQAADPLWMRYSAISPDGEVIAFAYKGDIFTVPVDGGKAQQITTNPAFDSNPIWSPDSEQIVFSSNRLGSTDLFLVNKEGGLPKRITTHSGTEVPITFKDDTTILFMANIMPSSESTQFSSGFSQVYSVSIKGERPTMFSTLPMEYIDFSSDGKAFLYNDKKGYEDPWRKHHTSSITRDIWQCELGNESAVEKGSFKKITDFKGEDRNPIIMPNGNGFYYLSEQDGTFNIYKQESNSSDPIQVTSYKNNPVRFLTMTDTGVLCFGYDGEIYILEEGSSPKKVEISIIIDQIEKDIIKKVFTTGGSQMAVSKDGEQIAFIYRGDVYVTSSEYTTTKRITNTPEQERNVDFAPDGRSIVYSGERDGLWQVYISSIEDKKEDLFPYATDIKTENLTNSTNTSFQPLYSPDGKEVAFLEDRSEIKVINLKSKKVRTVMEGKFQYSYTDGDQWYQWSPDSKWILSNCIFIGGWNNRDVALIDASGNGVMHNLTKSGYNDMAPRWVLDGKAMIWASDRAGYRSHGSWGAEMDIYIMFFDLEAYEKFRMNKEDLALLEEKENKSKPKKDKKKEDKKDKKKKVEPLVLDIENSEYRVARLTVNSSKLGDAILSKDGDKLFYLTRFEAGMDLWVHDFKERSTKILAKKIGYGNLILGEKGDNLYLGTSSQIKKINVSNGKSTPITYESVFDYKPYQEREYMFEHIWKQVKEKFYDSEIHGVDWENYKKTYAKFLPHISNNQDFAEMLSEMLGELNASHTGARYSASGDVLPTATLGVFYDEKYKGDGLKIKEIINKSPLSLVENKVEEGDIILAIDGEDILAGQDYYPLLEGKTGKKVRLTIKNAKNKESEVVVSAISGRQESNLLYQRWVENSRKMVDEISDGKIGYVHIQAMNSESFRTFYSEVLGRNRDKEAIVVDTRHNGGGWLHDDIVTLLSGKEYQRFVPRGQYIGSDPFNKWVKPSCMLICENNYSNAHGTPWVYQHLGIGKLVGAPVPGTMTAVWWERQIDKSIVFGIPQVTCVDMEGNSLENKDLFPEVLIYNAPADVMQGKDDQLRAAVELLMK